MIIDASSIPPGWRTTCPGCVGPNKTSLGESRREGLDAATLPLAHRQARHRTTRGGNPDRPRSDPR